MSHRPPIAALIGRRRYQLGVSQGELAQRLDVSPHQIAAWELGRYRPGIVHLRALARELQITVDDILDALEGEDSAILAESRT